MNDISNQTPLTPEDARTVGRLTRVASIAVCLTVAALSAAGGVMSALHATRWRTPTHQFFSICLVGLTLAMCAVSAAALWGAKEAAFDPEFLD